MAESSHARLLAESLLLPPYHALNGVPGVQKAFNRWQLPRFVKVVRELHATLAASPLAGHYAMSCGMLLGYYREGRVLPWDCWDLDLEVSAEDLPHLRAAVPALLAAGWRQRASWATNGGDLAEVRFFHRLVNLDFFVTYPRDDGAATYAFSRRDGQLVQAELHLPATARREIEFLGLPWLVPDPVDPVLEAMYGDWRTPDPTWDYMTSPAIVDVQPWDQPKYPFP